MSMSTMSPSTPSHASHSWHTLRPEATLSELGVTAEEGLRDADASRRRQQHGPNEMIERGAKSPWRILWEQTTAVIILVLLAAAAIKGCIAFLEGKPREWIDAGAILLVIILNVILGFTQEYRAEKAMAALKKLAAPLVRVRRNGRLQELPARDLVPGDLVLLEAGNAVPADLRLLESANLRAQEASLTGESLPVDKRPAASADANLPLGDRSNMLYLGTTITYGRGIGVVVATGMRTELGRIAELLQGVGMEATPLQKRIAQLGVFLALAMLAVVAVMFLLGLLRGESPFDMFLAAVAVAVAAIPEGLPAVMTITLALGAQRMLKRRALIRQLPAVEALGSVTTICSDKTGTLTENKMRVTVLDVAGHTADLSEVLRQGHPVLDESNRGETLQPPALPFLYYGPGGPWGTMVFMTLTLSQLGHAMAVRSNRESLFTIGLRTNPTLLWAVWITLALQLVVVYLPPLQSLFGTQPLNLYQLGICLAASTVVFWAVEIEKWLLRREDLRSCCSRR